MYSQYARLFVTMFAATTLASTIAPRGVGAAAPEVGKPAPAFSAIASDGKTYDLVSLAGKIIVLEWLNHSCPYVKKHYGAGNMQALQKEYTGKGVVWLSVISSAPGKQGHSTAEQANAATKEHGAQPTAVLLDESGTIGRLYDATTTPHMFVIGATGTLLYAGAIDDQPSFDGDSIASAKNYVRAALDEAIAGQPVTVSSTKAYGCSVKY
jgi:peroxiredoxin